jgi:hypothetical protein
MVCTTLRREMASLSAWLKALDDVEQRAEAPAHIDVFGRTVQVVVCRKKSHYVSTLPLDSKRVLSLNLTLERQQRRLGLQRVDVLVLVRLEVFRAAQQRERLDTSGHIRRL